MALDKAGHVLEIHEREREREGECIFAELVVVAGQSRARRAKFSLNPVPREASWAGAARTPPLFSRVRISRRHAFRQSCHWMIKCILRPASFASVLSAYQGRSVAAGNVSELLEA